MGSVLRVPQVVQREVGRDDQRLAAAVTAVNHIENLFQPVFRATLHAEIVKDKQGETAKAGYVFVPVLVAGSKVIEDKGKVRHAHGNLTFHKGIAQKSLHERLQNYKKVVTGRQVEQIDHSKNRGVR